jgi:hypothetical protein
MVTPSSTRRTVPSGSFDTQHQTPAPALSHRGDHVRDMAAGDLVGRAEGENVAGEHVHPPRELGAVVPHRRFAVLGVWPPNLFDLLDAEGFPGAHAGSFEMLHPPSTIRLAPVT